MKMGQMVLDVMTMGFAVVSLISWITSVISVIMVFSTIHHVKVINALFNILEIIINLCHFIFKACNCNGNGSTGIICDDNGKCNCKANYINDKCNTCNVGFYNFPTCEGNQCPANQTFIKQ